MYNKDIKQTWLVFLLAGTGCLAILLFFQPMISYIIADDESTGTVKVVKKPELVHGIHLLAYTAKSKQVRETIEKEFTEKGLNTVVIAVKEANGEVYIPGVKLAEEMGAYASALPDIKAYLEDLKSKKVYTVARIVVFKDNIAPRKKTAWAVKDRNGDPWMDYKGLTWIDPYNREAWEYNLSVASRCAELGFEEIQFDYIRFPSDGDISSCRYSQHSSSVTTIQAISDFLKEAGRRLKSGSDVKVSADVFGFTCSAERDMGIGQSIVEIAKYVDFVCPMVYPSHYPKGSYGIQNPNAEPYKTVFIGLRYAVKRLGENAYKLRPYLQDFSLGQKYTKEEVMAQIKAANDNNIYEWTLWNAGGRYKFDIFAEKSVLEGKPGEFKISTETLPSPEPPGAKYRQPAAPEVGLTTAVPVASTVPIIVDITSTTVVPEPAKVEITTPIVNIDTSAVTATITSTSTPESIIITSTAAAITTEVTIPPSSMTLIESSPPVREPKVENSTQTTQ